MSQFPWHRAIVDKFEKKESKVQKKEDQEDTGLRYLPWLFKDVKKDSCQR